MSRFVYNPHATARPHFVGSGCDLLYQVVELRNEQPVSLLKGLLQSLTFNNIFDAKVHSSPCPSLALKIGITAKLVTQALAVLWVKRRRSHPNTAIEFGDH